MGSRLYANVTGLMGGRDFMNAAHREEISQLLDVPLEKVPTQNSWAYDQIVQGIEDGKIKGLWVIATNSLAFVDGSGRFNAAWRTSWNFSSCRTCSDDGDGAAGGFDFARGGLGRKRRHIHQQRAPHRSGEKSFARAGQALSDFNIFRLVAEAWGCGEMFREWSSPEAVFQILKRISAGQPCDITRYSGLHDDRSVRWNPVAVGERNPERRGQAPFGRSDSPESTPPALHRNRA